MFDNSGGVDAARLSPDDTTALAACALLKLKTIANAANRVTKNLLVFIASSIMA
jgi:hypothetical protein